MAQPQPILLTTAELAERFPTSGNTVRRFYRQCEKWRERRLLQCGPHWRYRAARIGDIPQKEYVLARVALLILRTDNPFCTLLQDAYCNELRAFIAEAKRQASDVS